MVVSETPQQILSREFKKRTQRNSRYSMRQFAKSLGLSHSLLSLIISGKRPLSPKAAKTILEKLALSPSEAQVLLNSHPKTQIKQKLKFYDGVELQTFELISNWVHYAILSLLEIPDAKFEHAWIARRLNISRAEAKSAMNLLVSLNLVSEVAPGKWRQTGKSIKVENTISTAITKNFHRQLLEKAVTSLESDPMEIRDFSSMTLALDPQYVEYAVGRIRKFRRQLTAELESKGSPKEVYNLTVQLYPVSSSGAEL